MHVRRNTGGYEWPGLRLAQPGGQTGTFLSVFPFYLITEAQSMSRRVILCFDDEQSPKQFNIRHQNLLNTRLGGPLRRSARSGEDNNHYCYKK